MKRSTDRILTTHAGSLPRPADLTRMMWDLLDEKPVDEGKLRARVREAVAQVVGKQRDAGIDIVSDGEMSKVGFSNYVMQRYSGFANRAQFVATDLGEFPEIINKLFVENEGEHRHPTPVHRPHLQHEVGMEDGIPLVGGLAREIELGREDGLAGRLHVHMDVPRAPMIDGRDDGLQPEAPGIVAELMAAQPVAVVVVVAVGIGLPEVQERAANRRAVERPHRPLEHEPGPRHSRLDQRRPER